MMHTHRSAQFAPKHSTLLLILIMLIELIPVGTFNAVGVAEAAAPVALLPCELYPIGIAAPLLAGKVPGDQLDARIGWQLDGSHWLTWSGSIMLRTLVVSLQPPGDSATYRNPANLQDRALDIGDPVSIKPGVLNLANVRQAIDVLKAIDITVPTGRRPGGLTAPFVVDRFIRVRILSYGLIGPDKLRLRYLGPANCAPAPEAPRAEPVSGATDEDTSLSLTLRGSHASDTPLAFQPGAPSHGALGALAAPVCAAQAGVTNCTATLIYTPDANYAGHDSFSYTVSDGATASAPASVTLTVRPSNDAPVAHDDVASVDEDSAVTIAVLANDQDGDGDSLSVSAIDAPAHGAAALTDDGQIRYTPAADYSGGDSFGYTIADSQGGTSTAMVQVRVAPLNDVPQLVAQPDAIVVSEDSPAQTIVLTGADVETPADQLTIVIAALPARGSLTRNDGSQVTTSDQLPSPVALIYTPAADATGDDLLRAVVTDGGEAPSAPRSSELTLPLSLTPVNDAPTAAGQKLAGLRRGAPAQVTLHASDVDSAGLSFMIVDAPAHGQLGPLGAPQCAAAGDGSACTAGITYTPDGDFAGADSFSFRANDGSLDAELAVVSIVTSNAAPVAADQTLSTAEDMAGDIALAASDADGDPLTFAIVSGPTHGTLSLDGATASYTPAPNYHGPDSFSFQASDGLATSNSGTVTIEVTPVNDAPAFGPEPTNSAQTIDEGASLLTLTASDIDGDQLSFRIAQGILPVGISLNTDGSFSGVAASSAAGSYNLTVVVTDGNGGSVTSALTIIVNAVGVPLPPDPGSVAPPVNASTPTSMADATAFLYVGANPIQTGVAPGTIDAVRAGVLRGRVVGRDGQPTGGVSITIKDHPEYGEALTRADGRFDLAVNGGSSLTVAYEKAGLLPVQRVVAVPWQDYVAVPEVVMIALDGAVTPVELGAGQPLQVARANPVSDTDGTRRATLFFPAGLAATMVLSDGTQVALPTLHVRATEYTVGTRGPDAMPAELPVNSGYTYAAELSVDEALAAGATGVYFSQPVPFYFENFLDFPVGTMVPAGYYNWQKGQWIGMDNGRVIKILAETDGKASIDIDGSGAAASPAALAALGVSDAELAQLAALYAPGQSLWRTPLAHFSSVDCNFPWGPPLDSLKPNQQEQNGEQEQTKDNLPIDDDARQCGSVIGCANQTLGEAIPVAGTPYSLAYQSDHTHGYAIGRALEIPLSGPTIPGSVRAIKLEVLVAGQFFSRTFAAAPNQRYTFMWDGKDGYGRSLQGRQVVNVRVGYDYPLVYYRSPDDHARAWARVAGASFTPLIRDRQGVSVTVWQDWKGYVSSWSARTLGAEGWDLDIHHHFDPAGHVLMLGDGTQRSATSVDTLVINTVAGDLTARRPGDGGPALLAWVNARDIEVGPDGSVYLVDWLEHTVRQVTPAGKIKIVAGHAGAGFAGDGGPAVNAKLNFPTGLAIGPDGSIYIADTNNDRIRKVDPSGIITTVAGKDGFGYSGDNGPATEARLARPSDVAVGPDGALYIADTENFRIRKVNPDGTIFTIAGTTNTFVDNGPAYVSSVGRVRSLALGLDGSLYLSGSFERVRRITPDGTISTVAGQGSATSSGDGGPAIQANVTAVADIAIDPFNGDLYIAEQQQIRRVRSGIITTIAGTGKPCLTTTLQECAEGALAAGSKLATTRGLGVGPDGAVYESEGNLGRIRRIGSYLPRTLAVNGPQAGEGRLLIPSADGSQVYRFLPNGRHTHTFDALTGAAIYSFAYDAAGLLSSVTDRSGRVTAIERDGQARPTAIIAPNGQRTALTVSADGALERVVAPGDRAYALGYAPGHLLSSFARPGGATSSFSYDADGRLLRDLGPDGNSISLARTRVASGFQVVLTSSMGRATTHLVERLKNNDLRTTTTTPDGTRTIELQRANGSRQITAPDGTLTEVTFGPDPRWGMVAPVVVNVIRRSPSGLVSVGGATHTVQLATTGDPLSLVAATRTLSANGQTTTTSYNGAQRTLTVTSASGRTAVITLDAQGRVLVNQQPGALAIHYSYDQLGRLSQLTQGDRIWTYVYDALDRLREVRDPLARSVTFEYDAAGRVTRQTQPDGASILSSYTPAGELATLTPPGRDAHSFSHTRGGLFAGYTAPGIGGAAAATTYGYNLDRQPTLVERSGQTFGFSYDAAGRLEALQLGAERVSYGYDAQTGALRSVTTPDGGTITDGYDGSLPTSTTWAGAVAGSVGWAYTSDLNVAQVRLNGATMASYAYDPDGLMRSAGALSLTRDPQSGAVQSATLGGVVTSFSYDNFGDLRTISTSAGATTLLAIGLTRDGLGRIVERSETIGGQTAVEAYRYDLRGRLVEVTRDGVVVASYGYDLNSNRTAVTDTAGTRLGSYDGQDRLTQLGDATYSYTPNGELLSKSVNGQSTTYQYNLQGGLQSVALPGGRAVTYLLDGTGRRIGKAVDGAQVQGFLYDGALRPVAELDGAGALVSQFVYGRRANVPEYMVKGGVTYRIIADERGSPRLVVNAATGEVAQRIDYDVWGRVTADSSPGFQPFGFAGGLYDVDTGLVRFGARDYDPEAGRWTAKDPIGFRGEQTNLYSYVANDPVNAIDPSGLLSWDEAKQYWEEWKKELKDFGDSLHISKDIPDKYEDKARDKVLNKASGDRWSKLKGWYNKLEQAVDSAFKLHDASCEEDPGRSAAGYLDTGLDWLGGFLPLDIITDPAKTLLGTGIRNEDAYFQKMRDRLGGDTLLYPDPPSGGN